MSILFKVVSLYPYSGNDDSDLCFEGKQIINVTSIENEEWYLGNYLDKDTDTLREGIFPQNFVKKVEDETAPVIPRKPSKENKAFNAIEKDSDTSKEPMPEVENEVKTKEGEDQSDNQFAPELSLRERIAFMLQQQQQDTKTSTSASPPKREKVVIPSKESFNEDGEEKKNVEDVTEKGDIEKSDEVVANEDEDVVGDDEDMEEEEEDASAAHKNRLVERMAKLSGAGRIGGGFNPFGVAVPKSSKKHEESKYAEYKEETDVDTKSQMQFNIMTGEVMDMQQFNSKILKKTKTNEELNHESNAEVLKVFAGEDSESSNKKTISETLEKEDESTEPEENNLGGEIEADEDTLNVSDGSKSKRISDDADLNDISFGDEFSPEKLQLDLNMLDVKNEKVNTVSVPASLDVQTKLPETNESDIPSVPAHAYTNIEEDLLSSPEHLTLKDLTVSSLTKSTSHQSTVEKSSASSEGDFHSNTKPVPSTPKTSQRSFDGAHASKPSSPSIPSNFSTMSKSSPPPIPMSIPTSIKASPPPIPTAESILPNKRRKSLNPVELPKHESKPTTSIPNKRANNVSKTLDSKPPPIPIVQPGPFAADSIGIKKTKAPEIPPPMPTHKPHSLQRFETFDEANDVNSDVKIDFTNFFYWVNTGTIPENCFITNENPVGKYVVERDITENVLRDGHSKITIFNYYVLFEEYSYIVASIIAKNGNESILATDQNFYESKINYDAIQNMPNANGLVIDAVFKSIGTETNYKNSNEWVQSIFRTQKIAPIIAKRTFGANIFKYQPDHKIINLKTPVRAGDILVIKNGNFSQEALEILVITDFDSTELLFKCVSISNIGTIEQVTRNIQEMTKGKLRVFRPIPRAFINW